MNFQVGDSVVVKPGIQDPDLGSDIGGYQGRILEVNNKENTVMIAWDSITLQNIPDSEITHCEEKGLDWSRMGLGTDEVELTKPRDTVQDVERVCGELRDRHVWDHLGPEGQAIQAILSGIDPDNTVAALEAWEAYFRQVLRFPFKAEVSEFQERGPLQSGDKVLVEGISLVDDMYGIIVQVSHKKRLYHFPLCDLEATDQESPNYDAVYNYAVWYANR